MSKLSNFAAFILTHGRPHIMHTPKAIRKSGYTGKIYYIIDDEDKTGQEYKDLYGDDVITINKDDIASRYDIGDNHPDRRGVVFYARNACFEIAAQLGLEHFIQLDDDYTTFGYRADANGDYAWRAITNLDDLWHEMTQYLKATPFTSIAMSQGGDHIGGRGNPKNRDISTQRKAMNTFICRSDRPFPFLGRINEDVNTYTTLQRTGTLFLTLQVAQVVQHQTQTQTGGMTGTYQDGGTYTKAFYSVMYAPSGVRIGVLADHLAKTPQARIHHNVEWRVIAPQILRQHHKK